MTQKLQAFAQTHTWDVVPRQLGFTLIGNKQVYKVKYLHDGTFEHHKARLVARDFTQQYDIKYENFAYIDQMSTVHTLLAGAAAQQQPIYQWT